MGSYIQHIFRPQDSRSKRTRPRESSYLRESSNIPDILSSEFSGGDQVDWIVYDEEDTKLFCIAVWREDGKFVLGEFVNVTDDTVKEVKEKGFMTMIEAARGRDNYKYMIARHSFDPDSLSGYWKALVPDGLSGMSSPSSRIDLKEFLKEMSKLVKPEDVVWSNF